jgi:hypothetical protein
MANSDVYQILFTDQNPNREFLIQPFTVNGPSTPTGSVDPTAVGANTSLFLYGKGAPNYGDRLQEDMIYILENFYGSAEPSFPTPGQLWFNDSVTPTQLSVYDARKYTVVSNSGNNITIESTGGLDSATTIFARFSYLQTNSYSFVIYSPTFQPYSFTQSAAPVVSGNTVILTVSQAPTVNLAGYYTGGWESIFQGNAINVLQQPLNANGQNIQNLATPVNASDAVTKAYVDSAVTGGTIVLGDLGDVQYQTPGTPQNASVLYYNGSIGKWTDQLVTSLPFVPLAGGTMTGLLVLSGNPTVSLGAATKQYVDSQPLSGSNVTLTTVANNNILFYSTAATSWINGTALQAGILPLSGGSMTGSIVFSNTPGVTITGLPTPVNASDVANKAYVDSVAGGTTSGTVITSGTYSPANGGVLTLVGSPSNITVSGFAPNFSSNPTFTTAVSFTPPDPASIPNVSFSQVSLSDVFFNSPSVQDPNNVQLSAYLDVADIQLGRLTIPRGHLIMQGDNASKAFNLDTGSPNTLSGSAPNLQYVVGTHGLSVYVNGVKQVASTRGFYKLTNINTITTITGITFTTGTSTLIVPSNYTNMLRGGVEFTISGTSTTNDGSYFVVSSSYNGTNTSVVTIPTSVTSGASSFVASGTGTLTYGPSGIMPSMQTGYTVGGATSNPLTLDVQVNGNTAVSITIDTSAVNCDTFGLLCDAINSAVSAYYINPVVGVNSPGTAGAGSFVVPGDRTTQFPVGASFAVRYSSLNSSTYTVGSTAPTYNSTTNQTTIPVTTAIPSGTIDGIIFQDQWGYTITVQDGTIVFYSNVSGTGSSVVPVSGTLLTNVTGVDWPITISTTFTGNTNAFVPSTWAYQEIGLNGYPSQLVVFNTAPNTSDIIEFVIDRDFLFNATNPIANAVTAN